MRRWNYFIVRFPANNVLYSAGLGPPALSSGGSPGENGL
jgi:hypothetical protein